jgi:acyl-CoA synthetase (AMP-forming)/AMP-acid ligase II
MTSTSDLLARPFATVSEMISAHSAERPDHAAIIDGATRITYRDLDIAVTAAAAALSSRGIGPGSVSAICAPTSHAYVIAFLGTLRAGAAACPLSPSVTADSLAAMISDCGAGVLFTDDAISSFLGTRLEDARIERIFLEGDGQPTFETFCRSGAQDFTPPGNQPGDPFNIIYSSGTTGAPKGIVQPHSMRWGHVRRAEGLGYGPSSVTLVSTPLYSNTTLVSLIPTLVRGGTLVLMRKFDAREFLDLSQKHRATHAMLVPVQYSRIMAAPEFDRFDLSSYQMKTCTSAPFSASLKADVLARWPGGLVEIFGMTEGGGSCLLYAHEHPDKLHTVGRPAPGHDIRIIDETGREVAPGGSGEVVGRSGAMMTGYHNQPAKTAEAEWRNPEGDRFIRTGDIGRFDEDGFLVLGDRKKDMIISGGFNIYPSDLEAELARHEAVAECAVVGVASAEWGETPAAFVVLRAGTSIEADALKAWLNDRVGRMQRLTHLKLISSLPRSSIGKVLKRELRDGFKAEAG